MKKEYNTPELAVTSFTADSFIMAVSGAGVQDSFNSIEYNKITSSQIN